MMMTFLVNGIKRIKTTEEKTNQIGKIFRGSRKN